MTEFERPGRMSRRSFVAATGLALLAAGCGAKSGRGAASGKDISEVLSAVHGLTGSQRIKKLKDMAVKEGGILSHWTSFNEEEAKPWVKTFEEEMDIKVELYINDAESLLQKAIQEYQADKFVTDVYGNHGSSILPLADKGAFVDYNSPDEGDLVKDARKFDSWTGIRGTTKACGWNTNLVAPSDRPTSWWDLTEERWHGKLVMDTRPSGSWLLPLWTYLASQGRSEADLDELFRGIYKNSALVKGNSTRAQQTAAGEFAIVPATYTYIMDSLIDDGAPIAWQPPLDPLVTDITGVAVNKQAQHPAAALLFVDWAVSHGQDTLAKFGDPMRADLVKKQFGDTPQVYLEVVKYLKEQSKWDGKSLKYQQAQ